MKKILSAVLAVCCLAFAITITAFMAGDLAKQNEAEKNVAVSLDDRPSVYNSTDKPAVYKKGLKDTAENKVFEKINKSGKEQSAVYDDIFAYKFFKKYYKPSQIELAYIDELIVKGADTKTIIDIFAFWRTTSEDIAIIGSIYDKSGSINAPFWIEELFNQLTDNRHGVLDAAAIDEYISKGLTEQDISAANVLSRRGVYTISQILDKLVLGEQWADIAVYVEQNSASSKQGKNIKSEKIKSSKNIKNPEDIIDCIELADVTLVDPNILLEPEGDQETSITDKLSDYSNDIALEVYAELLSEGITTRDDINIDALAAMKQQAIQNGMPEGEIEQYLNEGYQMIDILNASEQNKSAKEGAKPILERQRQQKLERKGVAAQ